MKAEFVKRNIKKEFNGWWIISLVGAVVILLPILFIFSSIFQEPNENWLQIQAYLLNTPLRAPTLPSTDFTQCPQDIPSTFRVTFSILIVSFYFFINF